MHIQSSKKKIFRLKLPSNRFNASKKFTLSQIDVVYLSTTLSLYNFNNSKLRPAPLKLDIKRETSRDRIFSQREIEFKNMHLRRAVEAIAK